jgi:CBS domain containing-hemolysin-like protein
MTPRVQVVALDLQATCEDVANATRATGLSRFPVYRESLDSVVGVAHIRDVLAVPADERPLRTLGQVMREPLFVPESLTVDRLLDRLSGRQTMAVVIDEYGGTAGVATLEDIVEEVVGEVRDEHDPHETPDLAPAGTDEDGRARYDADGSARLDQLARVGLRAPDGPYETLAGLVAATLGRIPAAGDRVEVAGWRLDVVDATGRRAARVLLHAPAAEDAETAGQAGGTGRAGKAGRAGDGDSSGDTGAAARSARGQHRERGERGERAGRGEREEEGR